MAKPTTVKVTFWHMLRDVLIASINKGQFLAAILGLLLVIYFVRAPIDTITALLVSVINALISGALIGYALGLGSIAGWYFHAKSLRRKHHEELNRIASEKTEVQKKLLGSGKVKSSKKR
jgi:hypothetical protein